eukprot:15446242-Alexandrium_andersonii.AAC.1
MGRRLQGLVSCLRARSGPPSHPTPELHGIVRARRAVCVGSAAVTPGASTAGAHAQPRLVTWIE